MGCTDETFWDNSTANHSADCFFAREAAPAHREGAGGDGGGDGGGDPEREAERAERSRLRDEERSARSAEREAERSARSVEREAERAARGNGEEG